jgi:Zn-dependent peptidase ImmA (M78 family)/transcriptional regulator with XRE-family HTH domain
LSSGTPGFVGARLREAREARGLTAVALGDLVGASRAAISRYEDQSSSSPSPEIFAAMAAALKLPQAFFLQPSREDEGRTVFFRSQAATTKRARTRAGWKLEWLEDISRYLQQFVDVPVVDMPDLGLSSNPLLISDDDVEHAAEVARRHWGMSPSAPIANMTALLENQGAIITRQALDADTLDSLSAHGRFDDRPYIIVGTDKGSSARWRFDLAHELGHLLLHRGVTRTQWNTPEVFKKIEDQAHRFAGAFLLPLGSFSEELYSADLNVMRSMKIRWGVSIQLMIMRARQTDLITEQTARNLWINLSRRGWRRCEPFDEETLPEEPRTLRGAFHLIMENGAQTPQDIAGALSLDLSDIEGLVGLPRDYLSRSFAPVTLKTTGQVVDFPN